ncbi:MAG: phytanoyl-CoA dioxygenase family protein [Bacteroidetes bacterium]|nr:phytanoyl-CoA dioxygenase family protein [Bacteroidota bacterium]
MEMLAYDLATPYPVTSEQCSQFHHDGHILLRGLVAQEEIDYFRPLILGLLDAHAKTRTVWVAPDESAPLLEYASNLWQKSEEVRAFIFAKRFARVAAELMGVRGVRLYHDEALAKEPGGSATPWHKDHYNWPLATPHTIKMWIALSDIRVEMAPLRFASGTHRAGQFPEVCPSYEADELFERIIREHHIPVVGYAMRAGDASFHSGSILHSTLENTSGESRQAVAVTYYEDGARILAPIHEYRQADLAEFLPGLSPGEVAASPLNPLLFSFDEGI